jgi:hypothetical protein
LKRQESARYVESVGFGAKELFRLLELLGWYRQTRRTFGKHLAQLEFGVAISCGTHLHTLFPRQEASVTSSPVEDRNSPLVVEVTALELALGKTEDLTELVAAFVCPAVVASAPSRLMVAHPVLTALHFVVAVRAGK